MKLIKNKKWITGKSYQKRVLLDHLKGKIDLIQDVIIKPNGEIPCHSHECTDEIFYITEGTVVMVVKNKEFLVSPGDMIYLERGEKHGFRNESQREFKMLVLKMNFKKGDSYLK